MLCVGQSWLHPICSRSNFLAVVPIMALRLPMGNVRGNECVDDSSGNAAIRAWRTLPSLPPAQFKQSSLRNRDICLDGFQGINSSTLEAHR